MRGEKVIAVVFVCVWLGSPPHARGKALPLPILCVDGGITPACAGKSCYYIICRIFIKDHPRMRGEKFSSTKFSPNPSGSPPHARGKVEIDDVLSPDFRITPACAGKSIKVSFKFRPIWDHPRMRGEKWGR